MMQKEFRSIRPFIGAKNFESSRAFYRDLGFTETAVSHNLSLFTAGGVGFYLQDAYAEDWINNTMVFIEVDDMDRFYEGLQQRALTQKYPRARLLPVRDFS